MISRAKLLKIKKILKEDHYDITDPTAVMHSLVDHGLECLDKIDGGAEQRDWAAERAVSDKQVRLALADIKAVLRPADSSDMGLSADRALYILDCIDQMLKAKLAWAREWSYYQPRIDEEFQ